MKIIKAVVATAALGGLAFASLAADNRAVVINGDSCGLFDGNGNFVSTTDTHKVVTNSNNGNATFICKVKGVANDTGNATTYNFASTGALCAIDTGTGFVVTENWHESVSASGNATLSCHYNSQQ